MKIVKTWYFKKVAIIVAMALFLLGAIPAKSMAYVVSGKTLAGAAAFDRAADMNNVQRVLESKVVAQRLTENGLTATEIKSRLDKLTDAELHSFSQQVTSLYPGGDGGLSVLAALLVILIIALIILKMADRKIIIK
ncbi:MAG: PA2779 family protein [Deltaproteobacteria bacterium]|nr:PA2779 family protein [Deltaproteobacteria bacterium]